MTRHLVLQSLLALAPVCLFLGSLVYIDSYKLVRFHRLVELILAGGVAAVASYFVNQQILTLAAIDHRTLTRVAAPAVEEALKVIPLLFLFWTKRVGFVIDAAICGFAVGAGFALVENLYYLSAVSGRGAAFWIVRGFGTAVMHGGTAAIAAMLMKVMFQRHDSTSSLFALPGFLAAFAIHALFNQFILSPLASAVAVMVILPPLMILVFGLSERQLQTWLGSGFDIDAELIRAISSGDFASSRAGRYLQELRDRFAGPVVADMLCYLRLYSELSLRAKGMLMLRESGLPVRRDAETALKLAELQYLRQSIGPTGQLALAPLLHRTSHDVWQMQLLEER
ncbi:MAG TPA: PrsW family glutamic-type intramembrane protease [Thermoanaerobaculia bacterium]|nr:PrsW family glutamic-type intramembrane protease [Thermoanaerobaculia bacterium]